MATKIPPAGVVKAVDRIRHHLAQLHRKLTPAPIALMEMILATWFSQAITAAAQLGIADALAERPLTRNDLARTIDADPDAVGRLMRALISRGVFKQTRDGRYALNALGDALRSDSEVSMKGAALFYGSPEHREHWTHLSDSIRSGQPTIPMLRGKELFAYLESEPEFAALFNDAMTSISDMSEAALTAAYDFSRFGVIADVGGGHGGLLAGILAATPQARGVLFDLPKVVEGAPALLTSRGVADRVTIEPGSFFEKAPTGVDAYVMKNVIHDWPDEDAVKILRNIRAAASPNAKLLLFEMVIPDHNREFIGKLVDMEMLLLGGAKERTADQWRDVLSRAGFRLTRIVPSATPLSIIEAEIAPA
ncbi:methyltransferase [Mycolicibacterium celeriflavum]|uniref:Hydroxyneurosporene-O-methyltransferase n=1 Tax=Mycolicibacterium celeriflavum TaxID=1249101 RepID=A0A1X0BXL1_MYCCF|nr:methyltransferase [Mycolicibacterium celeriflavum]MCV7237078.1 hydroxyneurosporene methyltransferase [Mycolicibacterium celeriflavum]ORA48769.1 hydroxyneurosporene methyltransferase [Mycolicibacterium celeriflavum]BBY42913.1 hydroxyneurosporene-O-methyltransferase [Mycolicibacterium celeriflavum]